MAKRGPKKIKITSQMIVEIEELAGLGFTQEDIHNHFGMSNTCWYQRIKENPEIAKAFRRGKTKTLKKVVSKLMQLVNKGNITAICFYLKTQHRWSETIKVNANENDNNELKNESLKTMDPIEASRIYQSLMGP